MRIDEICVFSQTSKYRNSFDKRDVLTIEHKIIQSSIPKNFVIASLVHSRVTMNIGPTTKDTMAGTFTSMLRFSEPMVAFGGVLQLEDKIHF